MTNDDALHCWIHLSILTRSHCIGEHSYSLKSINWRLRSRHLPNLLQSLADPRLRGPNLGTLPEQDNGRLSLVSQLD